MPSPFPGMDPYLEEPAGWPDVHNSLMGDIRALLAASARPRYYVRIEERVYITDPFDDPGYSQFVPDITITRSPHRGIRETPPGGVLTQPPPTIIEASLDPEIRDYYLQVHDARSREVVTAIELLSPANKVPKSRGRLAMIEKRDQLRRAGAHWMEIDLLRAGERYPGLADRGDYCVVLWPAGANKMYAWLADIRDRLPTVAVPLREPDDDIPLDLQAVLDTTYDRAYYADSVDYVAPLPDPPLKLPDAAWVQRTLEAWRAARHQGSGMIGGML